MNSIKLIFRNILIILIFSYSVNNAGSSEVKKYETGIGAGVLFPVDVYISLYGGLVTQNANFLIRSYFDYYLIPQISFGFYANFSTTNLEKDINTFGEKIKGSGTPILGFGASIKPKFILSSKIIMKPGANFGYRRYFGDEDFSTWQGLALNGSCEFQYLMSEKYKFFSEIGFLFQPFGGNVNTDVTFDPNFYLVLGVSF